MNIEQIYDELADRLKETVAAKDEEISGGRGRIYLSVKTASSQLRAGHLLIGIGLRLNVRLRLNSNKRSIDCHYRYDNGNPFETYLIEIEDDRLTFGEPAPLAGSPEVMNSTRVLAREIVDLLIKYDEEFQTGQRS